MKLKTCSLPGRAIKLVIERPDGVGQLKHTVEIKPTQNLGGVTEDNLVFMVPPLYPNDQKRSRSQSRRKGP